METNELLRLQDRLNRRTFFKGASSVMTAAAMNSLLPNQIFAETTNFKPKAKRVIFLFQSGAPSQMDLFDHKPSMNGRKGEDLPDSIRKGQRLTTMTSGQAKFPIAPSIFKFNKFGNSGMELSELIPSISSVADELCLIRTMHTEAINHDPAITFCQTGSQLAGKPSIGSWVSYGLGSENKELPAYVVLTSFGSGRPDDQPLYDRLWSAGFLPSKHQGVKFRNKGDAVLYLSNPSGMDRDARRGSLDRIAELNKKRFDAVGDPEIQTRISQYEMAFRMQTSVPELLDISREPRHVLDLYGQSVSRQGSYASNCLLARRLAERNVRFIQLFHMGWDHHGGLPNAIRGQCNDTDRATAGLIIDLKQRGLLEDTLIVWGGEFGRTIYSQGGITENNYGRDHHPRCYSILLAGAGIKKGLTYGVTDDFCYNIVENPVSVYDLNATILHQLGINHESLTFKFQGLNAKLTGVEPAKIIKDILA
ncbi:MAG: DUF1501 domain-containing protein [Gemmataceae bacterium]